MLRQIKDFLFGIHLFVLALVLVGQANGQEKYQLTVDSTFQDGVPRGELKGPFNWKSKIYPGTDREYWVYVPKQYDASKAACLFVLQDGLNRAKDWKVMPAMDNLIHKQEMPVTIGLFIHHGHVKATNDQAQPRFNRSYEYDSLGDKYARFLLEEMLPEVKKEYNISDDPNDRAIAGASSGAICAFNVAWERPDQFRRVFSTIGTYVGLRGGDVFPTLIRKYEPKPIRVFLQDGKADLDLYGGSWWHANLSMLSALKFSGYDVNHAWGEGGHNGKHGAAIFPDVMRWLWRDYPEPIKPGVAPKRRTDIVIPGEDWQLVSKGHGFTEGPAVNAKGEVFFSDIPAGKIHRVGLDGKVTLFAENCPGVNGLMFSPSGDLYACKSGEIVRFDATGKETVVVEGVESNDILILPQSGYFTDPKNKRIYQFSFDGKKQIVDEGIKFPNGLSSSPDNTLLNVADTQGRFTYSFQIQADHSLAHKQTYGHLHLADDQAESGADGMTVDTMGRTYVTTRVGLQILDQLGRVHLILTKPQNSWMSNVVFGGPELDTLYVTCKDKVFKRKVRAKGVRPWAGAVKVPKPGL